jgi:hypothetical protein
MAKNLIIVDSCVLIKAFRKDLTAINDLKEIVDLTVNSIITYNKKDFDFIEGLNLFEPIH